MPVARARKRFTGEQQAVVSRGRAVYIDEGEASIDGGLGAQCHPDLLHTTNREHCFSRWQAVLLIGRDVLRKQYSTVHKEESQVAAGVRRMCRRRCITLRDLPANVTALDIDDT